MRIPDVLNPFLQQYRVKNEYYSSIAEFVYCEALKECIDLTRFKALSSKQQVEKFESEFLIPCIQNELKNRLKEAYAYATYIPSVEQMPLVYERDLGQQAPQDAASVKENNETLSRLVNAVRREYKINVEQDLTSLPREIQSAIETRSLTPESARYFKDLAAVYGYYQSAKEMVLQGIDVRGLDVDIAPKLYEPDVILEMVHRDMQDPNAMEYPPMLLQIARIGLTDDTVRIIQLLAMITFHQQYNQSVEQNRIIAENAVRRKRLIDATEINVTDSFRNDPFNIATVVKEALKELKWEYSEKTDTESVYFTELANVFGYYDAAKTLVIEGVDVRKPGVTVNQIRYTIEDVADMVRRDKLNPRGVKLVPPQLLQLAKVGLTDETRQVIRLLAITLYHREYNRTVDQKRKEAAFKEFARDQWETFVRETGANKSDFERTYREEYSVLPQDLKEIALEALKHADLATSTRRRIMETVEEYAPLEHKQEEDETVEEAVEKFMRNLDNSIAKMVSDAEVTVTNPLNVSVVRGMFSAIDFPLVILQNQGPRRSYDGPLQFALVELTARRQAAERKQVRAETAQRIMIEDPTEKGLVGSRYPAVEMMNIYASIRKKSIVRSVQTDVAKAYLYNIRELFKPQDRAVVLRDDEEGKRIVEELVEQPREERKDDRVQPQAQTRPKRARIRRMPAQEEVEYAMAQRLQPEQRAQAQDFLQNLLGRPLSPRRHREPVIIRDPQDRAGELRAGLVELQHAKRIQNVDVPRREFLDFMVEQCHKNPKRRLRLDNSKNDEYPNNMNNIPILFGFSNLIPLIVRSLSAWFNERLEKLREQQDLTVIEFYRNLAPQQVFNVATALYERIPEIGVDPKARLNSARQFALRRIREILSTIALVEKHWGSLENPEDLEVFLATFYSHCIAVPNARIKEDVFAGLCEKDRTIQNDPIWRKYFENAEHADSLQFVRVYISNLYLGYLNVPKLNLFEEIPKNRSVFNPRNMAGVVERVLMDTGIAPKPEILQLLERNVNKAREGFLKIANGTYKLEKGKKTNPGLLRRWNYLVQLNARLQESSSSGSD